MKRINIRTQLLLLASTSILLVLITGTLSVYSKHMVDAALDASTLLTVVLRNHSEADMMHDSLRGDVYEAVLSGTRNDAEHIREVQKEFAEHAKNFRERIAANAKFELDNDLRDGLKVLQGPLEAYIRSAEEIIASAGDTEKVTPRLKGFQDAFEALERPMSAMSDKLEEQVKRRKLAVDEATRFSELMVAGVTIAGVLLMLALGATVYRSTSASIRSVQRAVDDLRAGSGDLTYRLPAMQGEFNDLSASLNQFIGDLHDIVERVRDSASLISESSQQVAQGNQNLSARTEQQAAGLEDTAASMDQLTATVKRNAESAERANTVAQGASEVASRGGETVRGVVDTMEGIAESSRQIADIISVIDSIAFQTNILALNAAVEAARAGEQGRGFAVVASEVRALAQRSAQAAKEIKSLIQASVEKVDNGARFVGDAGKTMDDIVTSVNEVTKIISDISVSSREQLAGIEQVNHAIIDMDTSTQQNAAMVEQSAAAAEAMAGQAQSLVTTMARFKLNASALPHATPQPGVAPRVMRGAQVLRHAQARPTLPRHSTNHANGDTDWKEF